MKEKLLTKKETINFLDIPKENFENYHKKSEEIKGIKIKNRWHFDKDLLKKWNELRKKRTVIIPHLIYEKCFEFAIKMTYSGKAKGGSIRGARSEMQMADDFILGILAEYGLKIFLRDKFNLDVGLDEDVHPSEITPQDIVKVCKNNKWVDPKLNIGIKASKLKNCYLVLGENEYEKSERKSDIYIFVRLNLPSDHLFRILREHSFFKKVKNWLDQKDHPFRKIEELKNIETWICGFSFHKELEKVKEIPGQKFDEGYRYVKSVSNMRNEDKDWEELIKIL